MDKLKNQLGFVPKIPGKVIWLHCVSVGEFNAAKPLIDMIFINFPLHQINSIDLEKFQSLRFFQCEFNPIEHAKAEELFPVIIL